MKFRFSRKKNRGVAAIEFAIGFIFFWYMIAAWVEMSFMSYVSAVGDLAISSASQYAKKYDSTDFATRFNQQLTGSSDSLWKNFINTSNYSTTVYYLDDFSDLTTNTLDCEPAEDESNAECGTSSGSAIALYRVTYNYDPMFNFFLDSDLVFSREVIVIQENQRDQFITN